MVSRIEPKQINLLTQLMDAWASMQEAVRTFQNPDFKVKLPNDINPEDIDGVDPNDREQKLSIPRDGK
jgi:hypothetical protein